MPNERVIPTRGFQNLITFSIKVDGSEIPDTAEVLSIVVQKEVNRIPTAVLVLKDGDAPTQDFELSNTDTFIPGKEIEILAGYDNDNTTIFKGIIIKHAIKINANGVSLLTVECKSSAVKLTVGKKSKYFYDSKDADVIEEIIRDYGISAEVSETQTTHPELVQYHCTDWDFILNRSEVNGKICLVDEEIIKIEDPNYSQESAIRLAYGDTILEFEAEMDARLQYAEVKSKAWDFGNQEVVEVDAAEPQIEENGNISGSDLSEVIGLDNFSLTTWWKS